VALCHLTSSALDWPGWNGDKVKLFLHIQSVYLKLFFSLGSKISRIALIAAESSAAA